MTRQLHTDRWPIGNQIQHDTNVAAQDLDIVISRLSRLADRVGKEEPNLVRDSRLAAMVDDLATIRNELQEMK